MLRAQINFCVEIEILKEQKKKPGSTKMMSTVDRLLRCKQETEMRIAGLREQQIREEMGMMKDKPSISAYRLKNGRTPVH